MADKPSFFITTPIYYVNADPHLGSAYSTILADVQAAAARGVKLAVFPEFCLTGYTCGDLFLQHTLQTGALDALQTVLDDCVPETNGEA